MALIKPDAERRFDAYAAFIDCGMRSLIVLLLDIELWLVKVSANDGGTRALVR
jgi:hypothetical protein